MIDGVYAMVPYISGAYAGADADRPRELPSLVENDGYFISCARLAVMARVYDPDGAHTTDPLAWPYHASDDDLRGLPPHVISVCEVDPLRDEGLAYHRALHRAGVSTVARTVPGACHAGDLIFHEELPEIYRATVASIHAFVAGG
jgi:acetyl esterase/lipase